MKWKINNFRCVCISIYVVGIFSIAGCGHAPTYSSASIKATIVDEEDGSPLEGVVVVASWFTVTEGISLIPNFSGHGGPQPRCYQLANLESATSGHDGVFQIPAWGPKRSPCHTIYNTQPELLFYKPGYEVLQIDNIRRYEDYEKVLPVTSLITSVWNGKTIKLQPLRPHHFNNPDQDNYVDNLNAYTEKLDQILNQDDPVTCYWTEVRPALLVIMREERRLRPYAKYDLPYTKYLLSHFKDETYRKNNGVCGDVDALYQGLAKEVNSNNGN